jgi:hypothetical protein
MISCLCGSTRIRFIVLKSGAAARKVLHCRCCGSHKSYKGKLS